MTKRSEPRKQKRILTYSQSSRRLTAGRRRGCFHGERDFRCVWKSKTWHRACCPAFHPALFFHLTRLWMYVFAWLAVLTGSFLSVYQKPVSSFNSPSPSKIEWEIEGQTLLSATGMIDLLKRGIAVRMNPMLLHKLNSNHNIVRVPASTESMDGIDGYLSHL